MRALRSHDYAAGVRSIVRWLETTGVAAVASVRGTVQRPSVHRSRLAPPTRTVAVKDGAVSPEAPRDGVVARRVAGVGEPS